MTSVRTPYHHVHPHIDQILVLKTEPKSTSFGSQIQQLPTPLHRFAQVQAAAAPADEDGALPTRDRLSFGEG